MRALDLRSEALGNPRVARVVRSFFERAGRGAWEQAAALVRDPVEILGQPIARAELARNQDRSLAEQLDSLRELPPGIPFSADEERALFGGPLADTWRVCFVTLAHGEAQEPLSYGVVVDLSDVDAPLLVRLFDPAPFKRFAEALAAARHPTAP